MDSLPSYSPEVLPLYNLTSPASQTNSSRPGSSLSLLPRAPDHPTYHYTSDRIVLDLGPRRWGTRLPVYGRDGLVEGAVIIHSFKHLEKVVVCHVYGWECKFPFSFSFASEDEVPPSVSLSLRRVNMHIVYAVGVYSYCKGVHRDETFQREIMYLPRTTSRYFKPFVPIPKSEKRPRISSCEWHTSAMQLDSGQNVDSVSSQTVQLLLPHELRYPSGHTIPFIISATCANIYEPDVQLLRVSIAQTRTGAVRETSVIARGRIQGDIQGGAGGSRRMAIGTIGTGEVGKEFSWGYNGMVNISYEIRVIVSSNSPGLKWSTAQPIELTSHEWTGEDASGLPALSSPFVTRTALHLVSMNV
ncbi:hypothetical protein BDV93DRAFT_555676 [Ceratobasidium sp. AG-I]|nr:hypothetical protein BDV93DRAFT_555676 [Ceratobasidium sp. AG-I]